MATRSSTSITSIWGRLDLGRAKGPVDDNLQAMHEARQRQTHGRQHQIDTGTRGAPAHATGLPRGRSSSPFEDAVEALSVREQAALQVEHILVRFDAGRLGPLARLILEDGQFEAADAERSLPDALNGPHELRRIEAGPFRAAPQPIRQQDKTRGQDAQAIIRRALCTFLLLCPLLLFNVITVVFTEVYEIPTGLSNKLVVSIRVV